VIKFAKVGELLEKEDKGTGESVMQIGLGCFLIALGLSIFLMACAFSIWLIW